jgi:hypothetical protein
LEKYVNSYFVAAAVLAFVIGLVHSILGERLVFQRMRISGIIPVNGGQVLAESNVRILWASWHIVTVFGWGIAATLWWLADPSNAPLASSGISQAIVGALLAGSVLVLVGTKGKHPGWAGLLGGAILVLVGMYS